MVSFGSLGDVGYKALATELKSIYSVAFGDKTCFTDGAQVHLQQKDSLCEIVFRTDDEFTV
jgi:hypothetical protein